MYYNGKWYEECEMFAFVRQLEQERDAYKKELADWLHKACECIEGNDFDCSLCTFYGSVRCPSKIDTYDAKLRLEELR